MFFFLPCCRYAIGGDDGDFEQLGGKALAGGATISLPSSEKKKEQHREYLKNKSDGSQKKSGGAAQGSAKKRKM